MVSLAKSAGDKSPSARNNADNRLLLALGDRVRALRKRLGITRKSLAAATGVSERHLANLESGEGNVSVLVLGQVASALHCAPAELIGDFTTRSPEWQLLRQLLANRDEATLRRVRVAAEAMLGEGQASAAPARRIALIGLRGAGKSTLGKMLAERLDCPFIELSREIEQLAACSIGEIQALYGMSAYRRYERRALEQVIDAQHDAIIAIPGGLVSDSATLEQLLSSCRTVWLEANPRDHMQRVIDQGDFRPMQGNSEAMHDLQSILESRRVLYARAQYWLDTSAQDLEQTFARLCDFAESSLPASSRDRTQLENMTS